MLQGTRQPSDFEVGWAAGLFEGEGCIYKGEKVRGLQLAMKDEQVVRRFHSIVGCGSVRLYGVMWTWAVFAWPDLTRTLHHLLSPGLSERRLGKMTEVLGDPPRIPTGQRTHCPQGHPYSDENTYRYKARGGTTARRCKLCFRASAKRTREKGKGPE